MSVALAALDAVVRVTGPNGERTIPFAEFHRLPGDRPDLDTTLQPGELITSVDLPPPLFAKHSKYLKVRARASFAFALVSVATALQMNGNTVKSARIALGGVAHKPWCANATEQALLGKPLNRSTLQSAAALAVQGAQLQRDNAFKVALAQRAIVRAVQQAGGVA